MGTTEHAFIERYRTSLAALMLPYLLGAIILIAGRRSSRSCWLSPNATAYRRRMVRRVELPPAVSPDAVAHRGLQLVVLHRVGRAAAPLRRGLALLLASRRAVGTFRAVVYLPTIIPDVAYALIWLWLFNPLYGPLNQVLALVGIARVDWLLYPDSARAAIVIMSLFQVGEGFVVLLAALQGVPRDYYDAAAVDGAGGLQAFRMITLPLIAPWLLLLTVRDVILSTQSTFTPAFIMTRGDPYYATLFLPLLIYEEAFGNFRFGEGAAMLLMMLPAWPCCSRCVRGRRRLGLQ
jgi:multiple sugar transport system permease protein